MNDHEKIRPLLTAFECGILPPDQKKDVEAHVLNCDLCFEDLYEFAPAAQEILRQRVQSPTIKAPRREVHRFLMAAVLVITAAAGLWIYRSTTVKEEPLLRGSNAITLQSPGESEQLVRPVLFRWNDGSNADEYVVSIYNEDGRVVHQNRVKTTEYLWKPEIAVSPALYHWKVEAYLTDGTRTSSSKISEFRLK